MPTLPKKFGAEVALLVDGVTKLNKLDFYLHARSSRPRSLRKMFLAMAKDIRVVLIKLADRLHNMRTLKYPEARPAGGHRPRDAGHVRAACATGLGMSTIKWELEDLALRYIDPRRLLRPGRARWGMKREEREKRHPVGHVRQLKEQLGADRHTRPRSTAGPSTSTASTAR